jgi:hypothetical protein
MSISTTISKTIFNRLVMTTCVFAKLAAGAVLLAGVEGAHRRSPIQNGGTGLKQD